MPERGNRGVAQRPAGCGRACEFKENRRHDRGPPEPIGPPEESAWPGGAGVGRLHASRSRETQWGLEAGGGRGRRPPPPHEDRWASRKLTARLRRGLWGSESVSRQLLQGIFAMRTQAAGRWSMEGGNQGSSPHDVLAVVKTASADLWGLCPWVDRHNALLCARRQSCESGSCGQRRRAGHHRRRGL